LEASALGGLIAACPAWKKREKRNTLKKKPLLQVTKNINYTVSHKKTCHFYFCDNFGKCRPILKILSVLHPGRNGGQSLI